MRREVERCSDIAVSGDLPIKGRAMMRLVGGNSSKATTEAEISRQYGIKDCLLFASKIANVAGFATESQLAASLQQESELTFACRSEDAMWHAPAALARCIGCIGACMPHCGPHMPAPACAKSRPHKTATLIHARVSRCSLILQLLYGAIAPMRRRSRHRYSSAHKSGRRR
jgi:hypothetical protein